MLELCWCPNRVDTVAKDLRDYFKQFVDEDVLQIKSMRCPWNSNDLKPIM